MNLELIGALEELEKERGIAKDVLIDAIETAIVSAYKRNFNLSSSASVRVDLDETTGAIHVYSRRRVVDEVTDDKQEITLEDAQEIDPNYEVGDIVEEEVTPKDFGRIAAQTAKQVVIQRIREAERSIVFNEYANRAGDVVNGIIQRIDHRNVIIDLGKVEAVLPVSEQIPGERYEPNQRMKFYINEVKQSSRGPQIFLSRTHPGLLKYLFELEVPEIQAGVVEIKSVAREAGFRSKLAVFSRDENVDPVGACVGSRGMRVQAVVSQLNGEKIDIVAWVPDEVQFIGNALSPAAVTNVLLDEETKTARVIVPDDQLSLAIGKEGQNARLAARLTGWKIDIKSETQAADEPLFQPEAYEKTAEVEEADELADSVLDPDLDLDAAPVEEIDAEPEVEIEQTEAESAETVEDEPSPDEVAALLAKIGTSAKRKSWEERFGSVSTEETAQEKSDSESDKPKQKKKKEKVIKDFSMLTLEDFQFDEED
ncbi:MAG: transcription termination factor NusA [Candidatus Wallacebacter cryptica]